MHVFSLFSFQPKIAWQLGSRTALKRLLFALAFVISTAGVGKIGLAQKSNKPVVDDHTLRTQDGIDIKITYFKAVSSDGKNVPIIILLHGKSENRQKWKDVASVLQENGGFAIVTVDLRNHGDSQLKTKKIDYQAMAINDLDAVKEFIFQEHQAGHLNMSKMGIVGCDFSASVAIVYTEYDWSKEPYDDNPIPQERTPRGQDVQALVLVSPDLSTPQLFASKSATAIREIEPLAVMIAASEKSGNDYATSKKLFDQIAAKRVKSDQFQLLKYSENLRGLNLVLHDDKLKNDMADFLAKFVRDRDRPETKWRDRRSLLER